jgi:trigger factor
MQVTELSAQGLLREYKIVVPAATLADKVNTRLAELAKTAQLPGFRPGKVPTALLKKQFGPALYGEALEQSIQDGATKLLEDRGLKPALQPKVDIKQVGEDKDLEFEVRVEVLPEIAKIDFPSIELERLKVAVDDQAVNDALGRIAQANREQKPVDPPRAAEKGDILKVDFVGTMDGKEFPGGSVTDYSVEIGSGGLIPGFEDQLVGLNVGESRDVKVTFPADYGAKELAGKDASFKVDCKEIRALGDQPVDDSLAKKTGFETLENMRKEVSQRIEQDYAQLSRGIVKRKLLDKLSEMAKFDVPQGLVDAEFDSIWKQYEDMKKRAETAGNAPSSEDEEKSKAEYRGIAERRVRLGLLLADIGRANNIQVSNDEIGRAIVREAQRFPGQEQKVFEFYTKNAEMRDSLRAPIYEDKTIDFILELAKVTDRSVSADDLVKAAREGDSEGESEDANAA